MTIHATTFVEIAPRRRRTLARTNAQSRLEVIRMLKEDHQLVKAAFRDLDRLECGENYDACEVLVRQTCLELELHAQLKEQVFYPALRADFASVELLDEAQIKHQTMKVLIDQLKGMSPRDDKFSATFNVLGQYVRHHIREEENKILRRTAHLKLDWAGLFDEMQERRNELMEELGSQQHGFGPGH